MSEDREEEDMSLLSFDAVTKSLQPGLEAWLKEWLIDDRPWNEQWDEYKAKFPPKPESEPPNEMILALRRMRGMVEDGK